MRISVLSLLLLVIASLSAFAQSPDNSQNKGLIHGSVIDSRTGQPVENAEISLRLFSAGSRGEPNN
jgi:hypothetical protein